jgi:hypothetical protein
VSDNSCFDGKDCIYSSYSHFNLTMKTKGADPNNDIYFAEVTCMSGDYEAYVLTCFCMVKPDHNGILFLSFTILIYQTCPCTSSW